jgi:hypothetical protein
MKHSRRSKHIVISPFSLEVLRLEYDCRTEFGAIGADRHKCCDILAVCTTLPMLCFSSSTSYYSRHPLIRRWEAAFIHSVNILWADSGLDDKLLHQLEPLLCGVRVQGLCTLGVKRLAPVRLEHVTMPIQEALHPAASNQLAFGAEAIGPDQICVLFDIPKAHWEASIRRLLKEVDDDSLFS